MISREVKCYCCGSENFTETKILWPNLINEWQINKEEVDYINLQQGFTCNSCGSNLRSITLAYSIMQEFGFEGVFSDFVKKYKNKLKVLEINEAGHLTKFFKNIKNHDLVAYPEVDIMKLETFKANQYDLVVHSDTLEHVSDPVKACKEVKRVMRKGGVHCFTVPIIKDRLTRSRSGLKPSYHGSPGEDNYLVYSEFGADVWKILMEAGYNNSTFYSLMYPAGIAISAKKPK